MLDDRILSPAGVAALSAVALAGIAVLAVVLRLARAQPIPGEADALLRVVRNSSLPIASQFFVRGVDLLIAIAILRLLGPSGNGEYALAVIIWLYVKTISDFGLGLYATREISRDFGVAGRVTGGTALFRLAVLAVSVLPVAGYIGLRAGTGTLSGHAVAAVALLLLSIVPGSISEASNSALNGVERMDLAAGINAGVNLVRAPLAVLLAATSLGVAGIAVAALVGASLSAAAFLIAYMRAGLPRVNFALGRHEAAEYARESWPLLLNALLVSLFFRFDIFILEGIRGAREVGLYDAAFKPINMLTIIPAYATLAVFPLMSRRASDPAALARAQRMTAYVLVTLAWAIVALTVALAEPAIRLLAGSAYLPESALLLRILVLFAPLSFLNGVFQYVLVAQGRQRRIIPAFAAAVLFNIAGNLLLVPWFGARASATLTVLTEIVIFAAFAWVSRGTLVAIHERASLARLARPTVAGLGAAAAALLLRDMPLLAAIAACGVFALLALALRVIGQEELALGRRVLARGGAAPAP
jgi:O-antigen/teichoic acid export membrane protein